MPTRSLRVVSVVGARPEFVQASPVSTAFSRHGHREFLVHTGQHYDAAMAGDFFAELDLPTPAVDLGVGSGTHAEQTAAMLVGMERVLDAERPDFVLVRGDTNSTLAGALAAAKLNVPVVHLEAGERSGAMSMPEEVNRVVVDRLSALHLCASQSAVRRLEQEGIRGGVFVGDVMLDALLRMRTRAEARKGLLPSMGVSPGHYVLATVHRAANTDDPARLRRLMAALGRADEPVLFPCHPRTARVLESEGIALAPNVRRLPPVGYLDMLALETHARVIATDSGGVQREAYHLGVPCLTLRDETEWRETLDTGWNRLVGADEALILEGLRTLAPRGDRPPIFGDGHAGEHAVSCIERWCLGPSDGGSTSSV